MFHYEKRGEKPIPRSEFHQRLLRTFGVILGMVGFSLAVGILGYRFTEGLPWLDAFLNASMILGGMGPVDPMKTDAGKFFAGCYALYAGLAFVGLAGLLFAPFAHRMLHRFHYETDKEEEDS